MASNPELNIESALKLPCGVTIKNRICKAAMTEGLADEQNRATQKHATLYQRWAEGGAGILLTGNVQIDHRYLERPGNVVIEGKQSNEQIARLRAYAEAGTKNDTHLWMQISHAGRQTPEAVAPTPVGPSDIQLKMTGATFGKPRPLEHDEILDIIARFAHTAQVAKDTGFTGVQLHGAHGYLLSEFLSPDINTRTDEWGGSLANRARLLIECIRAVRKSVGTEFPVALKLNSSDFQKGGFSHEDAVQVASWLSDEGLDLLEVSGGTYEQPKLLGLENMTTNAQRAERVRASTVAREAYFLDYAKDIRAAFKGPLMVTGGFRSRTGMDAALEADSCDVIGVGRPLCVDSDVVNKLLSGAEETTTNFEKELTIGPKILSSILGLKSHFPFFATLNGWGQQGWWCLQIINMGEGREPDLDMGVFKALTSYQASEKKAADAYNAHWNA